MELYHYSKEPYTELLTKRASGVASDQDILKAVTSSKLRGLHGHLYVDHISFFLDPIPSIVVGNIFHGHSFWVKGNTIYEHVIDVDKLEKNIEYEFVESEQRIELLDQFAEQENWTSDDPAIYKKWLTTELTHKYRWKEIGESREFLKTKIKELRGHLGVQFMKARERDDYKDNAQKYAAFVPHVMLYPSSGAIKVEETLIVTIGKETRKVR
jgi:hypothetical protein